MGVTTDDRELKNCITNAMEVVMGHTDSAIISASMSCIKKNLDKKSTISLMRKIIEKKSTKFVEEIYRQVENRKAMKRKGMEVDSNAAKVRRFEEPDDGSAKTESPGALTTQQIQLMMKNAKQQLEERKKKIQESNPAFAASLAAARTEQEKPKGAIEQALANDAQQKALKAAELQKRIGMRLSQTGLLGKLNPALFAQPKPPTTEEEPEPSQPKPLILDDQGRTVDSTGQLLQIPSRVPTLIANVRAKKQEQFRQKLQEKPDPAEVQAQTTNSFFDARVKQESAARPKRSFKFYEEGKFQRMGQKIRTKVQLEKLQDEIAQAAKRTGIQQASKLALIAPKLSRMQDDDADETPHIEWWDSYVYNQDPTTGDLVTNEEAITNLIEHPIQLEPPGQGNHGPSVLGTYLTKKERKKIRRINRREALKDEQEKIRLGLMPPPEPKVKLSNLMRVLGTEAVRDPTKVEQHVRMQMEKRKRAHEQANASRKLTDEQRKEKRIKKLKEDTSEVVHVVIYRVKTLRDPKKKYKVEINSKQLYMTGCTLLHPDINVVVVEGGPKAQRFFKRLMMKRLRWEEDKKGKRHEEDEDGETKWCEIMWSGETKKRNFGEMTFKQVSTSQQAREFFAKHGVEHYWDSAHAYTILQE